MNNSFKLTDTSSIILDLLRVLASQLVFVGHLINFLGN